jgi:hypothetical protein
MVKKSGSKKIEYEKVSIPKPMALEIQRIIESDEILGFVSIQEFVKESVRSNIVKYGGTIPHD